MMIPSALRRTDVLVPTAGATIAAGTAIALTVKDTFRLAPGGGPSAQTRAWDRTQDMSHAVQGASKGLNRDRSLPLDRPDPAPFERMRAAEERAADRIWTSNVAMAAGAGVAVLGVVLGRRAILYPALATIVGAAFLSVSPRLERGYLREIRETFPATITPPLRPESGAQFAALQEQLGERPAGIGPAHGDALPRHVFQSRRQPGSMDTRGDLGNVDFSRIAITATKDDAINGYLGADLSARHYGAGPIVGSDHGYESLDDAVAVAREAQRVASETAGSPYAFAVVAVPHDDDPNASTFFVTGLTVTDFPSNSEFDSGVNYTGGNTHGTREFHDGAGTAVTDLPEVDPRRNSFLQQQMPLGRVAALLTPDGEVLRSSAPLSEEPYPGRDTISKLKHD